MFVRTSTLLSTASLIVSVTCAPALAGEFATKEEAIAMVKKAMAFIKEQGPDKAYAEISHTAELRIVLRHISH